jgi:putative phage-type endonuclease
MNMSLTAEQQAIRATGIGASEIASVVGLNPWRSSHDLWLLKRGLVTEEGNVRTRMGNRVEACVLEEYQAETGATLAFPGTVRHPTEPWMLCTPDAQVVGAPRIVEVKCVGWRSAMHWGADEDAIPDYYRPQCEWQMAVLGAEECHVAAWIGGSDFKIYTVRRNPRLADALVEAGRRFWFDNVIGGDAPQVDGSEGARRMLAELYPRSGKPMLHATAEHDELADLLARARLALDEADASKRAAENRLIEAIGDADGIKGANWKITYRTSEKTGRRSLRFTEPTTKLVRAA